MAAFYLISCFLNQKKKMTLNGMTGSNQHKKKKTHTKTIQN